MPVRCSPIGKQYLCNANICAEGINFVWIDFDYAGFRFAWGWSGHPTRWIQRAVVECSHLIQHLQLFGLVNVTALWLLGRIFSSIHSRRSTLVAWVLYRRRAIAVYSTRRPAAMHVLKPFVAYFFKKLAMQNVFMGKSYTRMWIAMGKSPQ